MKPYFILLTFTFNVAFSQGSHYNIKGRSTTNNNNFSLNSPSCDELINYRDNELAKQFNSAYDKYKLNAAAKRDIERIKQELFSDKASWYEVLSTKSASSDIALAYAEVAQVFKTLCDKYSFILKILSGNSLANTGIEYGSKNLDYWYRVIKSGKMLQKAVMENAEKEAYKEVLSKGGLLQNSVKAVWEFADNVDKFSKLDKDHKQLKSEIKRLVDMLDEKYSEYEGSINSSLKDRNEIIEIVKGIDKYWEENCKDKTGKKINNPSEKDLANNNKNVTASLAKNKKQNGPAFYIFLTTDVSSKGWDGKKYVLISEPCPQYGDKADSMEDEKQRFLSKVNTYLIDRYGKDNAPVIKSAEQITVWLSKPYSTSMLHSVLDANAAIEGYKQMQTETLQGLTKFEFVQL